MSKSQSSYFKYTGKIGYVDFLDLQAGVRTKTIPITQDPPFGPNSKILGFERSVSGGTVGTPFLAGIDIGAGNVETITLKSTSATDTSFYIMRYVNPEPLPQVKSALNLV